MKLLGTRRKRAALAGETSAVCRFGKDKSGGTAVEFAVLAIPFILLVFAIMESAISFAAQQAVANATDDVARQLRTGQIKRSISETDLRQRICDDMSVMVQAGCPGMVFDLRQFSTFAEAANYRFRINNGALQLMNGNAPDNRRYDPGASTTKNMLRVFYEWPLITDIMRKRLASLSDGNTLLTATAIWQNEPFDD